MFSDQQVIASLFVDSLLCKCPYLTQVFFSREQSDCCSKLQQFLSSNANVIFILCQCIKGIRSYWPTTPLQVIHCVLSMFPNNLVSLNQSARRQSYRSIKFLRPLAVCLLCYGDVKEKQPEVIGGSLVTRRDSLWCGLPLKRPLSSRLC